DVILNKFLAKYGKYFFISKEDVDKGVEVFDKYGNLVVLFGRLIPIIRTVISFPAGLAKMNFVQFISYTIVGSTIWSTLLISAGYLLGNRWEIVEGWIDTYQNVI